MSANNWAVCPRCFERWGALTPKGDLCTFREDYELGITEDGLVYIYYAGVCRKCGLSFRFDHEEKVLIT